MPAPAHGTWASRSASSTSTPTPDTVAELYGRRLSHGTPFRNLVDGGYVDPRRYAQIGLRGWWLGSETIAWQEAQGITSFLMADVRELGIEEVVRKVVATLGAGPRSSRWTSTSSTPPTHRVRARRSREA